MGKGDEQRMNWLVDAERFHRFRLCQSDENCPLVTEFAPGMHLKLQCMAG